MSYTYKLGCPNCRQQIEVPPEAANDDVACPACSSEYRVPPLPARQPRSEVTQTHRRFNFAVSAVATLVVAGSVSGMMWWKSNEVHGESPEQINGSAYHAAGDAELTS